MSPVVENVHTFIGTEMLLRDAKEGTKFEFVLGGSASYVDGTEVPD